MESLDTVTGPSRLFVIIGAPNKIEGMPIETSIARGLNETGGIYGNELWISADGVDVVVEVRTACRADKAFEILKKNQTWYPIDNFILYPSVSVFRVKTSLETGDRRADQVLSDYLRQKVRRFTDGLKTFSSNMYLTYYSLTIGFSADFPSKLYAIVRQSRGSPFKYFYQMLHC